MTNETTKEGRPVKKNGYSHKKADLRKKQKRIEAEARQAAYDAIPLKEKLKLPMGSKQRARLEKLAAKATKKA